MNVLWIVLIVVYVIIALIIAGFTNQYQKNNNVSDRKVPLLTGLVWPVALPIAIGASIADSMKEKDDRKKELREAFEELAGKRK